MMNTDNLRALAKLLREVAQPNKFDMGSYISTYPSDDYVPSRINSVLNECGTTACALGHAPILFAPLRNETWGMYCDRVCGFDTDSPKWNFLFSYAWYEVDNTPLGAAKRIEYLLEYGCPDDEDIDAMQRGDAELCYE